MRLNDLFKMVYNLIMFQVRKKPFECLSQGTKQPGRTNAFTLEIAVFFFMWRIVYSQKSFQGSCYVSFSLQLHTFMTTCKQQTAL